MAVQAQHRTHVLKSTMELPLMTNMLSPELVRGNLHEIDAMRIVVKLSAPFFISFYKANEF